MLHVGSGAVLGGRGVCERREEYKRMRGANARTLVVGHRKSRGHWVSFACAERVGMPSARGARTENNETQARYNHVSKHTKPQGKDRNLHGTD